MNKRDTARAAVTDLFWSRVDRRGPDECWPWMAGKDRDGYGHFQDYGRTWRAPRWALNELGLLPPGLVVRHTCDNPPCVNPAHLVAGTVRDNAADMVARGRANHGDAHWTRRQPHRLRLGENNCAARLTEAEVLAIRTRYRSGAVQVALAAEFGVSQPLISQIVRRKAWSYLKEPA